MKLSELPTLNSKFANIQHPASSSPYLVSVAQVVSTMAEEKVKKKAAKDEKETKEKAKAEKAVTPAATNGGMPRGPLQQPKKRRHPPDRKQPAWLFPPDDKNPVLNPKPKSEKEVEKETAERLEAISFLQHKAVGAPHREPPPHDLLSLVGAFLTSFGFNHTCRILTQEWVAKAEILDDWVYENIGKKNFFYFLTYLLEIYNDWRREWDADHGDEATASEASADSDEGDPMSVDGRDGRSEAKTGDLDDADVMSVDEKSPLADATTKEGLEGKPNGVQNAAPDRESSDSSDATSNSDASDDRSKKPRTSNTKVRANGESALKQEKSGSKSNSTKRKAGVEPSTSSSSTSESEGDDEKGLEAPKAFKKGTIDSIVNTLKRKQSPSAASTDGKTKGSKSHDVEATTFTERPKKKSKLRDQADQTPNEDIRQKKPKKSKAAASAAAPEKVETPSDTTATKVSKKRSKPKSTPNAVRVGHLPTKH